MLNAVISATIGMSAVVGAPRDAEGLPTSGVLCDGRLMTHTRRSCALAHVDHPSPAEDETMS